MKKQEAIDILNDLQEKLGKVNGNSCGAWKSQATFNIIKFFGKDSPQYEYMNRHDFYLFGGSGGLDWHVSQTRPGFSAFISGCINDINNHGLKKREWNHALITTNPALFWTIFSAIVIFSFFLGTHFAANKSNDAPYNIPDSKQATKNGDTTHLRGIKP